METKFILLMLVSILQFCTFASSATLMICGPSKYGFEVKVSTIAINLGYTVEELHNDGCDLNNTIYSDADVVISFDVINPEEYTYDLIEKQNEYENMTMEYYGIIDMNLAVPSCTVNNTQMDIYRRSCSHPGFNKITKLFRGSFEDHQVLYNLYNEITKDLVDDYDFIYVKNEKKEIVVCKDPSPYHPEKKCYSYIKDGFEISCKSCYTQDNVTCSKDTIAVIAPTPKKLKTCDENIPVIFYDSIYVEPNNVRTVYEEQYTSDIITSTTMIHWKALASSLRNLLNKYAWPRVAVVSDDSLLSHYMKNDQEKYFIERKALFTIIRDCTEERDFREALKFLNEYQSKVIIVNVAKPNLRKFIKGARAAGVSDAEIIWLFPGHRDTDIKDFKYKFFVHLSYDRDRTVKFVMEKYKESFGVEKKFKKKIKQNRPIKTYDNQTCHLIEKSIPRQVYMSFGTCAIGTSNYFYHCADWYVLFLILAIIVFLLLVFVVLVFFMHIQNNTLAYKPVHKPPSLWRQLLRRERPPTLRQRFPLRRRY